MGNIFETLGASKEMVESVQPEEIYEGKLIPAGVYDAVVDKAYLRKTDSGAKMFELDLNVDVDGEIKPLHYSTAVQSGDEKGNKTYWVVQEHHADSVKKRYGGVGAKVPLPGFEAMVKFLRAIDSENADQQETSVDWKGSPITVLAFKGLNGKKLKVSVIQEEGEYEGEMFRKNEIIRWLKTDGTNDKGEDMLEKAKAEVEKKMKKLESKTSSAPASGTTASTSEAATVASSGW